MLLVCIHCNTGVAQDLAAPIVAGGGSACGSVVGSVYKEFPVKVSVSGGFFNDDNVFFIEMSDENGLFTDASKVKLLKRLESTSVDNYNKRLDFQINITLPDGTFGKMYKVRVRGTSPVKVSGDSAPFEAYTNVLTDSSFDVKGSGTVPFTLCSGETLDVELTTDFTGEYQWYRREGSVDVLVGETTEPRFTVKQPGLYYAVINYGVCGIPKSIFFSVVGVGDDDAKIKEDIPFEICGNEDFTFEASSNKTSYTYDWYKDGVLKQSSNSNTYTTPTTGQFGVYHLIVKSGTCEVRSTDVELKQRGDPKITITENVSLLSVLLPGEAKELSITINGSATYTIEWYRDGTRLFGGSATTDTLEDVSIPGEYVARVVESSTGGCLIVSDSKPMRLLNVKSFNPIIITDDSYIECEASEVDLKIDQVKVIAEDDNEYILTTDQLDLLNYQWKVDDSSILGQTEKELSRRNSHTQTGKYKVVISIGPFVDVPSNELDIKLITGDPVIESVPSSNSLCPGGKIVYTIKTLVPGYTYEWFKNDDTVAVATNVSDFVVTEVGNYVLKVSGFGCEKAFDPIEVILFDATAVKVTPSEKVVLVEGETTTAVASGAESYVWYEGEGSGGKLLSTTESLDVDALGFYTVVASVGACTVEKIIEVVEQDDQIIVPNIVTPNGDGKNDFWAISNRYAFQPSVLVIIYNANGKELVNITDYKNDWPLEGDLNNQRIFYYKIIRDEKIIKAGTISVLH